MALLVESLLDLVVKLQNRSLRQVTFGMESAKAFVESLFARVCSNAKMQLPTLASAVNYLIYSHEIDKCFVGEPLPLPRPLVSIYSAFSLNCMRALSLATRL